MTRVPDLRPNRLTGALAEVRATGCEVIDLTGTNPVFVEVTLDQVRALNSVVGKIVR